MAENSKIEWTTHTQNFWTGCEAISPGCEHCYAESWAKRAGRNFNERKRTTEANWKYPERWNETAGKAGVRAQVFTNSLADFFDNQVPEEWRRDAWNVIRSTPWLDWQILTKRIGNAVKMLPKDWCMERYDHVWIGATVVNQEEADRDIPKLLAVPARIRFLSIEPMLGPITIPRFIHLPRRLHGDFPIGHTTISEAGLHQVKRNPYGARSVLGGDGRWLGVKPDECTDVDINWVIAGGESGDKARPVHPDWIRSLRDQCAAASVPFHFKQWGEWLPGQNDPHPYMTEPHSDQQRRVAHHQDGTWGETNSKLTEKNYAAWSESVKLHKGPYPPFRVHRWAERIGKKKSGRLLDGVEHNGFPT